MLDLLAQPRTLSWLQEQFAGGGVQQWMNTTAVIVDLHKSGAILDADAAAPALPARAQGFDSQRIHLRMLNDRTRTSRYLDAIAQVVRPDDVVCDIGTGSGILALAAARAGARHVYAVEAGHIGEVAREMFAANGYSSRITLIRGRSTAVELPERANVLVSEIIGNEPLGENIVQTLADARRRLCTPELRQIPRRMDVVGLPVMIPGKTRRERQITRSAAASWRDWYGFDFGPLAAAADGQVPEFTLDPRAASGWPAVAGPVVLARLELGDTLPLAINNCVEFAVSRDGRLDGLVVSFRAELADGIELTSTPGDAAADCSWKVPVTIMVAPVKVKRGDRFAIHYAGQGGPPKIERRP